MELAHVAQGAEVHKPVAATARCAPEAHPQAAVVVQTPVAAVHRLVAVVSSVLARTQMDAAIPRLVAMVVLQGQQG